MIALVVLAVSSFVTCATIISGKIDVGWYLVGNIFIGGLIGWLIVDPLTGAMWTLSPDMIYAPLGQQSVLPGSDGDLVVILKQDIPAELYETLGLVRINWNSSS